LRIARWEPAGEFAGKPALRQGGHVLVEIPDLHLYHDHVDREAAPLLGGAPEVVVFLSKHKLKFGPAVVVDGQLEYVGIPRFSMLVDRVLQMRERRPSPRTAGDKPGEKPATPAAPTSPPRPAVPPPPPPATESA
ncbi:MAG TPA: hypothetical protein VK723_03340, partial [Thermoplasmata archaeon]|nr:hypothetical protein [Thermoplasmata archaeon]